MSQLGTRVPRNQVIKSQDEQVYNSVECLRGYARVWRDKENAHAQSEQFEAMVKEVKKYNPERLQGVARAFTHFLALSNSAENVHRVRRLQQHLQVSEYEWSLSRNKRVLD